MNWSSAQALNEDLLYIAAAYDGYIETLRTIFGSPEDAEAAKTKVTKGADGKPLVLTPSVFDFQFGDGKVTEIRRKPPQRK